jgi:hypothetical protein
VNPTHLDPFAPADSPLHPAYVAPAELELPLSYSPEDFANVSALFPDDEPEGGWQHTAEHESAVDALAAELESLFGAYATTEEHEAAQDGQGYPELSVLRQRAAERFAELVAARPAESALKPEWVAYYQLVFSTSTEEQAAALTVADLKEQTKLDGVAEVETA